VTFSDIEIDLASPILFYYPDLRKNIVTWKPDALYRIYGSLCKSLL
jgi:hypothetical protein